MVAKLTAMHTTTTGAQHRRTSTPLAMVRVVDLVQFRVRWHLREQNSCRQPLKLRTCSS
jgi:hypothetical protein